MKPSTERRRLAALGRAFLLLGATLGAVSTGPHDELTLEVADATSSVELQGQSVRGENLELQRRPNALSGTIRGRPLRLRWDDWRVSGEFEGRPVELSLWRAATGAHELTGYFGGRRATLEVHPTWIRGMLDGCRYALVFRAEAYVGTRDCGGPEVPVQVSLRLPRSLSEWPPIEGVTLLSVVLSEAFVLPAPE